MGMGDEIRLHTKRELAIDILAEMVAESHDAAVLRWRRGQVL